MQLHKLVQVVIDLDTTLEELQSTISQEGATGVAFNFFNYNVESFGATEVSILLTKSKPTPYFYGS